jgi:hypothetical protein
MYRISEYHSPGKLNIHTFIHPGLPQLPFLNPPPRPRLNDFGTFLPLRCRRHGIQHCRWGLTPPRHEFSYNSNKLRDDNSTMHIDTDLANFLGQTPVEPGYTTHCLLPYTTASFAYDSGSLNTVYPLQAGSRRGFDPARVDLVPRD